MTTPTRALQVARAEIGYVEQSGNRTKYGRWYGMDGAPWCAMFTSWVLQHAGLPRNGLTHFAYTPTGYQSYQRAGRRYGSPQPGDLVFFAFARASAARPHGISHIGIVEAVEAGGAILTIEGNTDSAGGGSGGRVMRKRRNARIVGYGRPAWSSVAPVPPPKPKPPPDPWEEFWMSLNAQQRDFLTKLANQANADKLSGDSFVRQFLKDHRAKVQAGWDPGNYTDLNGFVQGMRSMGTSPSTLGATLVALVRRLKGEGKRLSPEFFKENRPYTKEEIEELDNG